MRCVLGMRCVLAAAHSPLHCMDLLALEAAGENRYIRLLLLLTKRHQLDLLHTPQRTPVHTCVLECMRVEVRLRRGVHVCGCV